MIMSRVDSTTSNSPGSTPNYGGPFPTPSISPSPQSPAAASFLTIVIIIIISVCGIVVLVFLPVGFVAFFAVIVIQHHRHHRRDKVDGSGSGIFNKVYFHSGCFYEIMYGFQVLLQMA